METNATAYNSYFKWKKFIKKTDEDDDDFRTFCDVCLKLNLEDYFGIQKGQVNDLESFWGYKKNCLYPNIENGIFKYYPINYTHKCTVC